MQIRSLICLQSEHINKIHDMLETLDDLVNAMMQTKPMPIANNEEEA